MLIQGLGHLEWPKREFNRAKGLQPKIRHVPGGGAVFSTQIDPAIQMALEKDSSSIWTGYEPLEQSLLIRKLRKHLGTISPQSPRQTAWLC